MKAMILAAGFGTRLGPLTEKRPKALMPIANIPVIDRVIAYLASHGVKEIVINAHHHADQMLAHFSKAQKANIPIHLVVEKEILGTGGGIKNVEDFFDKEPFIVINADILTDINLARPLEIHQGHGHLATLILHDCPPFNQVRVDEDRGIVGFEKRPTPGLLAFTGIHILSKRILDYIPKDTFSNIIYVYRNVIQHSGIINYYLSEGHYWRDVGTIKSYIQANKEQLADQHFLLSPNASIHPSAKLDGWAVVGASTHVGKEAFIKDSILWGGIQIGPNAHVIGSIVTQDIGEKKVVKNQVV
ncbi:MAG: hypothetical protein DRG63_12800 [Deltaproteobacteria bacterium]|nr:MAG: hypothetical protein DRG63_12800 [Deltaproteobacteria bacterium]